VISAIAAIITVGINICDFFLCFINSVSFFFITIISG
jgi:hypothetical protein